MIQLHDASRQQCYGVRLKIRLIMSCLIMSSYLIESSRGD